MEATKQRIVQKQKEVAEKDERIREINKQKFVVVCEMNCDLLDKPKFDVNNDPDSVYKTQNQNYQAECDTKSNRQEAITEDVDLEEAIASDYNVYENCKFPNIKYRVSAYVCTRVKFLNFDEK